MIRQGAIQVIFYYFNIFSKKILTEKFGRKISCFPVLRHRETLKIGLPLRPAFLIHQSRYEEKDHRFRIFRHFSSDHSVQNILENSLTVLKLNLK